MKTGNLNLRFDERGLIPAIVQDFETKEVLTLAYMNEESLKRTLEEGETWFWSRSRSRLWHKGETSGNTQRVVELMADCDADALIVMVEPSGPACHTGASSCFGRQLQEKVAEREGEEGKSAAADAQAIGQTLEELYALIEDRKRQLPKDSYTAYLFKQGLDKILKKFGEEAAETIIAAKNKASQPLVAEVSDLVYHLVVLLVERGVSLKEIAAELETRRLEKESGR
jgi:phosphoribosyl-AMP cyclohydrolase / phosphoribosyl-ATP pyrophosphohydrolase